MKLQSIAVATVIPRKDELNMISATSETAVRWLSEGDNTLQRIIEKLQYIDARQWDSNHRVINRSIQNIHQFSISNIR